MPKFVNPFAHLMGLKKSAKAANGRRAEEDERDEDAEDDEENENADDDDRDESAEESDNDENADDDSDDEKAKKAKKARGKKAQEDDSDDADASVAKGRRMEKKRIASILGCKAAAGRPDLAAYLACQTSVSSASAIEQLNIMVAGMPAPDKKATGGRVSLDERMGNLPRNNVGHDAEQPTGKAAGVNALVSLYNSHKGNK